MFDQKKFFNVDEANEIIKDFHHRMNVSTDRYYALIVDATQDNSKVATLISDKGPLSKVQEAAFSYSDLQCYTGNTVTFYKCGNASNPLGIHVNMGDGDFVCVGC